MARIALVHDHVGGKAGGGGGVRQMLELALALDRSGHHVTVACLDFEPGTEHRRAGSEIEIRAVREGEVRPPAGRFGELTRIWREMPEVARAVPRDAEIVNAHET